MAISSPCKGPVCCQVETQTSRRPQQGSSSRQLRGQEPGGGGSNDLPKKLAILAVCPRFIMCGAPACLPLFFMHTVMPNGAALCPLRMKVIGTSRTSTFALSQLMPTGCAVQGLVLFSRLGVYIPLPGVDVASFADSVKSEGLLGYIDTLSGGSISRVGIFSLGGPAVPCSSWFSSLPAIYMQDLHNIGPWLPL